MFLDLMSLSLKTFCEARTPNGETALLHPSSGTWWGASLSYGVSYAPIIRWNLTLNILHFQGILKDSPNFFDVLIQKLAY